MSVESSRHDPEIQLVTAVLRAPLPPARPHVDPAVLWACGRHARRIGTEARISLVVTAAQVIALVGVMAVLVSFVDWRGVWAASTSALQANPSLAAYGGVALLAVGAARWTSSALLRKT
jgi:hypothetical protein